MAVSNAQVAVSTTAVALNTAGTAGINLRIVNVGATNEVYLGSSSVTSSNGVPVAANGVYECSLDAGDVLYAICAAAESTTVAVLRT